MGMLASALINPKLSISLNPAAEPEYLLFFDIYVGMFRIGHLRWNPPLERS
jgi:hypothetical protein